MKDIFNFFKTPSYQKADIILGKSIEEKKILNKKMIIIIFIVKFLYFLTILLNPFSFFAIEFAFGIENTYIAFLISLLLNLIILLIFIIIGSYTIKFTLKLFKIEKSYTESLFIFLSGNFFIANILGSLFLTINFLLKNVPSFFSGNLLVIGSISIFSSILGFIAMILVIFLIVSTLVFYGNIFKNMWKGFGFIIVNDLILYLVYILLGVILGDYFALIKIF